MIFADMTEIFRNMVEVEKIYISKALKVKVEEHKRMMIEANPDKAEMIESCSFAIIFSDWLMKYVG